MKISDIAYVAIRLDAQSKRILLRKFIESTDQILVKYSKFFCDHVTLEFGENVTFASLGKLGTHIDLTTATKFVMDDKVVYLPVLLLDIQFAHITVATDAMTAPVYSRQHYEQHSFDGDFSDSLHLKGTIVAYMKNGMIIDHLI